MGVGVYVVGRPRDAALGAAIAEYEQRASRYWDLEVVEVKGGGASGGDGPEVVRRREGERLLERIPAGAQLVLCDVGGEALDSEQFARWLLERRDLAQTVAFVIGGAHGVSPELRARAAADRLGPVDPSARARAFGAGGAALSRRDHRSRRTVSQVRMAPVEAVEGFCRCRASRRREA